jgi:flagellar biosynthesis chaperone FliJ
MNIKTASAKQLNDRKEELSKEYEKTKSKLLVIYKKLDSLSAEYEEINEILKTKK